MHIAIDACCLGRKKTGNETYIRGLLSGFETLLKRAGLRNESECEMQNGESGASPGPQSSILPVPPVSGSQRFSSQVFPAPPPSAIRHPPSSPASGGFRFTVLTTAAHTGERAGCFDWVDIPLGNFVTRNFLTIPKVLKRLKPDLYHGVYWSRFFALPVPTVLTIHDLSFVGFPQGFHRHEQLVYANLIRLCAWSAKHILTISESSKREMMKYWMIPAEKITVAYLAQDACYSPLDRCPASNPAGEADSDQLFVEPSAIIPPPFAEGPPYILYVGNLHPRKNIVRLLEGFVRLKRLGLPHRLKIVGQATWMAGDVFSAVRDSGLADEVEFTGYISYEAMVSVYRGAAVFVYPSLYEGFGLPVLEAMACGCPVVCSNTTSVPEVAGDAAVLVNPESADDLAEGIRRVLTEPGLARELRERGIQQAAKFTWPSCAETTLAVYRRVIQAGGG